MENEIINSFRNAQGSEVKHGYTQYTDLKISSGNREFYMGCSNGEVTAITAITGGGLLLLPVNNGENSHRLLPNEMPTNLVQGKNIVTAEFDPFDDTLIVGLAEDKSSSPASVIIFGIRYKPEHVKDIIKLNSTAERVFYFPNIHSKRPCEVLFNPLVKNLFYSAGSSEIHAMKYEDDEVAMLCDYSLDGSSFVTDIDLSPNGKYFAGTFFQQSSTGTELKLALFKADYQTMLTVDGDDFVTPIAETKVGSSQQAKVAFISDNSLIVSRLDSGRRHLALIEYDVNTNELKEKSYIEMNGTSPVKVRKIGWENLFFAYGRGDVKIEMYCAENNNIAHLGTYKSPSTILGLLYMQNTYINPQQFELIRFMIGRAGSTSSKIEMGCFFLPRSGSFENSQVYKPMLYNEPSLTSEEFEKNNGPIIQKTIDPVHDYDKFMAMNKIERSDANSNLRVSKKVPGIKKLIKTGTKEIKKEPVPVAKPIPVKSEPKVEKPDVFPVKNEINSQPKTNTPVGEPIRTLSPPKRRVGVTKEDHMELLKVVDKMENEIKTLKEGMAIMRQEIAQIKKENQAELMFSDSE